MLLSFSRMKDGGNYLMGTAEAQWWRVWVIKSIMKIIYLRFYPDCVVGVRYALVVRVSFTTLTVDPTLKVLAFILSLG